MKLVLAEELNGAAGTEQIFVQAVVTVGRDPSSCDRAFDQQQWPMVSRLHAEFRLENGQLLLRDLQSKFGTLVDGQPMAAKASRELREGMRVQFGAAGPIMRVLRFSASGEETDNGVPVPALAANDETVRITAAPPVNRDRSIPESGADAAPPPRRSELETADAFLEPLNDHSGAGPLGRTSLAKDVIRLGREPVMDVVIAAGAGVVSRRHAEIARRGGGYVAVDLGSFNGTLVNERRITGPTQLAHGDTVRLGTAGPGFRFVAPGQVRSDPPPSVVKSPGERVAAPAPSLRSGQVLEQGTIVMKSGMPLPPVQAAARTDASLLARVMFGDRPQLSVGRALDNDIVLDGLQISNRHARFVRNKAEIAIEDTGSSNGVFVNGQRISQPRVLQADDFAQIGPFLLRLSESKGITVFDTRSKTSIEVIEITKTVPDRSGCGSIKLLDDVSLTINPNEFIGLLGPSGAGKSTLMDAMNGMRPASGGRVYVNNRDFYQQLDALKQSIGYVPQDDIIHRELTVRRTLHYTARLRLSRDVETEEVERIVDEVMDVTGLSERGDVPVSQLSGGQRKRVSIAVELVTKPSIMYLDEPTSGLDPATEDKIMRLFRQIAESGRTIILTTHAMENVRLFDKIVIMMRGKLVWYGPPMEALAHVGAATFKELYDKLEAPIEAKLARLQALPARPTQQQAADFKQKREQIAEETAEEWKRRFRQTSQYGKYVAQPMASRVSLGETPRAPRIRPTITDALRQTLTLGRRYGEVLRRDRVNLAILLAQGPIIALLTWLVVNAGDPRDFLFFILALVPIWFGTSVAAREIIRERAIYNRERMVNLGLAPYLGSKLAVLLMIVTVQCVLLFLPLKILGLLGVFKLPGLFFGGPQLAVMILAGAVGIALGLCISAAVKSSEMATSLVPLILIPQILFAGLVGVPKGLNTIAGAAMPATWAFDEIKRLSLREVPVLRGVDEGAAPAFSNDGRGYYKQFEHENEERVKRVRADLERYSSDAELDQRSYKANIQASQRRAAAGDRNVTRPEAPKVKARPVIEDPAKIADDLSDYVNFLHPWGHAALNIAVLLSMFAGLTIATIAILRSQDVR